MTISIGKSAETYQEVAKYLNLSKDEIKRDSRKLLKDVYVNDGTTGGTKQEVNWMIGVKLADRSFSEKIQSKMKRFGLKLKTTMTW